MVDPDGENPIIIGLLILGYLLNSTPAVAPTGNPSDGPAIQQAHYDQGVGVIGNSIPGGSTTGKVSMKVAIKEVVKN
jgi:hypothetical protein